MPTNAMGKPQAAEVATAFFMDILNQCKKGTVMVPPPIPTMLETKPITVPPAAATVFLMTLLC